MAKIGNIEEVGECIIEIISLPRVSQRRVGDRILGLPGRFESAMYRVTLVSKPTWQTWQVDAVEPVESGLPALTVSEKRDLKDLLDIALKEKYSGQEFRLWTSSLIDANP